MAPASCALDQAGLEAQLERYRVVGASATSISRRPGSLAVHVGEQPAGELIEQLISVERACCPFFALSWDPAGRMLGIAVSTPEHEPALEAIAYALGAAGER